MQFKTIPGTVLLEDSNYNTLYRNIQTGFPNTTRRQHAVGEVFMIGVEYVPNPQQSTLQINGQCRSHGHMYRPVIIFANVEYHPDHVQGSVTVSNPNGSRIHVTPVQTSQNVQVRCTCLDFYFRFSHYNDGDNSLAGPPMPPYQRKTTDRPPANPAQVPGLCRHLIKLVDSMKTTGLISR